MSLFPASDPAPALTQLPGPRKKVVVIGAGMAGLVAAYELARAGHDPLVLEAQQRVGGRVLTLRSFAPGLYAEAGAMRIPAVHTATLGYCEAFGLALRPFVMQCDKAPVWIAGRRLTYGDIERDVTCVPFDFSPGEKGRGYTELWTEATKDILELFTLDPELARTTLAAKYDTVSIGSFLRERGFSEGAIELYGLMSYREANMGASVVEQLREILGRAFDDMSEVAGGTDLLPAAFYDRVRDHVRLGASVTAVEQRPDGVTVRYRTAEGDETVDGDYVVCTVPLGVLTHIDFQPGLSPAKYRAIRELNYNPSTKILLQVKRRFWEDDGVVGGATATDLPIRRIVYPSHPPADGDERGVLLASYTWGQDAARWGALTPGQRIELAIRDVAKIHPRIHAFVEGGDSYAWYNDPHAAGAFALFQPGQETLLHPVVQAPEGRIHFAGEHCSLWHAWIEGALESGLRAAERINAA